MDFKKITELLEPFLAAEGLSARQTEQVSAYIALLLKWNAKTNLTAVRGAEEIVTRHFGESFFAASRVKADGAFVSAIDLGSGAGFPGMPLAIYSPEVRVTLVESQNKKATFLKEVVRALDLKNVKVFNGRGEEFGETADVVTLRAVEKFEQAAATAAKLVVPNGRVALLIGEAQAEQARELLPDFEWHEAVAVPKSSARVLIVGRLR
jgi:16S rRNA (guanine527-N7)-methyltransferase